MSSATSSYTLGPDNAKLTVRTGKTGAARKAGHNLKLEVRSWSATIELGPSPSVRLTVDARSLKVLEGTGGIQSLGDDDKASIEQTIDDEVLKGGTIEFSSDSVLADADGHRFDVRGELDLLGTRRPISFELTLDEAGRLTGEAVVKQTDWKMKPYSALFGTLKVADEVRVTVDGRLPEA